MNDKDKEAFEKNIDVVCNKENDYERFYAIWEAACEYARDEFKFQTPPAVIAYQEINDKLQAENAKLLEVVKIASKASCYTEYEDACSLARQVLEE